MRLTYKPFGTYFRNTLLVAGLNVIAVVCTSSFCAYGFARMRFPGARFLVRHRDGDALFLPYACASGSELHRVLAPGLGGYISAAGRSAILRRRRLQYIPHAPIL